MIMSSPDFVEKLGLKKTHHAHFTSKIDFIKVKFSLVVSPIQ